MLGFMLGIVASLIIGVAIIDMAIYSTLREILKEIKNNNN